MTRIPDVDLTLRPTGPLGPRILRARLLGADYRLFEAVATRHWPGADVLLPRLTRGANHGVLWFATATAIAATRTPRARAAAARGLASLALASATINTVGKRSVRRPRPVLDSVPLIRQLKRQPITTSFPSGHAASAAAFATGVALESSGWGAAVAPLATAVVVSRVYTGVHFPSDVLAGAALGVGAAYAVRALVPTREQLPRPERARGRVVHGGRRPAVRLLAAALAGPLTRSPAHAAVRVPRLRVDGVAPCTLLAYDGEVTEVAGEVTLQKLPEALTVYRPRP